MSQEEDFLAFILFGMFFVTLSIQIYYMFFKSYYKYCHIEDI